MSVIAELDWETLLVGFLQISVVIIVSLLGNHKLRQIDIKVNGNLEKVREEARKLGDVQGHERGVNEEQQRDKGEWEVP